MSAFFNKNWFDLNNKIDFDLSTEKTIENQWDFYFDTIYQPYLSQSVSGSVKIYKAFKENDIQSNKVFIVSKSIYSEYVYDTIGTPYVTNLYTSSLQPYSHDCITNVYIIQDEIEPILGPDKIIVKNKPENKIFDIIYANYNGSGSENGNIILYNDSNKTYDLSYPSKAFYFSLKQLIDEKNEKIQISGSCESIFALNISANYLYDGIAKNSFELKLSKMNNSSSIEDLSYIPNVTPVEIVLTGNPDDDRILYADREFISLIELNNKTNAILNKPDFSYIVSGSLKSGVYLENNLPVIYGKLFYNIGLLILDASKIDDMVGLGLNTGSNVESYNSIRLFKSINSTLNATGIIADGNNDIVNVEYPDIKGNILSELSGFVLTPKLNINQQINSIFYRCVIDENEFNYSTNPSYYDDKDGSMVIKHFYTGSSSFYIKPQTYISSIGLYDSTFNLIAVAKISNPVRKSFDNKLIINVRIDY